MVAFRKPGCYRRNENDLCDISVPKQRRRVLGSEMSTVMAAFRCYRGDAPVGARGTITSRRPKMRASSEYAPGPSIEIAAATIAANRIVNLPPSTTGAIVGNHESDKTMLLIASRMLTAGVRKPMSIKTPATTCNEQNAQLPWAELEWPDQ